MYTNTSTLELRCLADSDNPDPSSDQLLQETSEADPRNHVSCDFVGPLHWFPITTDRIVGLCPTVDGTLMRASPG